MYRVKFRIFLWSFLLLIIILLAIKYIPLDFPIKKTEIAFQKNNTTEHTLSSYNNQVTIVVVVCGQRSEEALVMMKSAVIFQGSSILKFIILAVMELHSELEKNLRKMMNLKNTFSYEMVNLSFPVHREQEWKSLFKPCAAQRLFLPNILLNHQFVLYVDTDTIFLNELSAIWQHVGLMNSSQMAAVVLENEDPNISWYSRFARHPFYGNFGINSGVMMMNLTKMREFKWVEYMDPILTKFKSNITFGDQDIINIIFHYHPDKLYIYDCTYNYRPDHCMYKSVCKEAEQKGVTVLHGSRGVFHSFHQKSFKTVFETFQQYKLGTDIYKNLVTPLIFNLKNTEDTHCGTLIKVFTQNIIRLFGETKSNYV